MSSTRSKRMVELARIDLGLPPLDSRDIPKDPETVTLYSDAYVCEPVKNAVENKEDASQCHSPMETVTANPNNNELDDIQDFSSDDSVFDQDYVVDAETSKSSLETSSSDDNVPLLVVKRTLENDDSGNNKDSNEEEPVNAERKRFSNGPHTRQKRRERTIQRNKGEAYVTAKGKEVKKREMKPLPNCRAKCRSKISEDMREIIFAEYWALGNRDQRVNFIASNSETSDTAVKRKRTDDATKARNRQVSHRFYFKLNGQKVQVCRSCFMKTLGETQMFVTTALENSRKSFSGVVYPDKRGRHEPKNKYSFNMIQEVVNHINSFPAYESHYTRRTNDKKYLPPHLTLQKMYELYCEGREVKVSRRIYESEFHKLKLAFKKPKVDTCHKCDVLQMKLKCAEEGERHDIEKEIAVHHAEADKAYKAKEADKITSKEGETMKCYSFDLQQCLPTPFVNSSVSFYKRQLWTYNLTLHEMGNGKVVCIMWHEGEGGRGGNQIATCLFEELIGLPNHVKRAILYSDTCGGQNKNSHVAAMFLTVMQRNTNLEIIDHKFMVSGHSHMECDVDHALIEKQKKKLGVEISHPHDWYQLVRSVGKRRKFVVKEFTHEKFLNFADLYKNSLVLRKKDSQGNNFKWHDCQWLRYTKEPGTVFFKYSLDDAESFKQICFSRRGKSGTLLPQKCYNRRPPISDEKKQNLLELLPLISPPFRQFYLDLQTSAEAEDTYPDIVDFDDDGN